MNVYTLAWIATILLGLEVIVAKLTSKYTIANPWLFNFLWRLFILIFTIPVALYFGAGMPTQWTNIIWGAALYTLGRVLYTFAIYKLDVSVLTPLFSFRPIISVALAAIFLREILTPYQYGLIFIIFMFGVLVSMDEKFELKSFFNRDIFIVIASTAMFALYPIFLNKAVAESGFWTTTLWSGILGQILLLLTMPLFKKELTKINLKQYGVTIITASIGFLAVLTATAAYAKNVSLASPIISLPISMVIAFLFSIFAPKLLEKHTLKVYIIRFISVTVMLISVLYL